MTMTPALDELANLRDQHDPQFRVLEERLPPAPAKAEPPSRFIVLSHADNKFSVHAKSACLTGRITEAEAGELVRRLDEVLNDE